MEIEKIKKLAALVRYFILVSTTAAGSGHPSSSLSAADLITVLMFGRSSSNGGFFRADLNNPAHPNNDRLIFSKGHASPLFYSLYAAAGKVTEEELKTLRKFGSKFEGHPTMFFPYTEAATGSLGQGLSVGVGMALNAKYVDKLPYRTFVLIGDSEMAEGSVWEAIQLAAHYKLDNLVGILDVNRLGQRGETMYGHDVHEYEKRIAAFGWETIVIDGHSLPEIIKAYEKALARPSRSEAKQLTSRSSEASIGTTTADRPIMIIAKTAKGKGISFMENADGWHGKAPKKEELEKALEELGDVDKKMVGVVEKPADKKPTITKMASAGPISYTADKPVATRRAYGNSLVRIFPQFPNIVVLDAEVSNSTYAEIFKVAHPDKFFEMFIAEQNMAGAALGFSRRGKIPFISSFSAFLTRAFDQIRMSQYSDANIKFVGSHAGVSIGEDGASQMGLEDIAMFRVLLGSTVLYPSDAYATERLVEEAAKHHGIVYIRTTRKDTPILYTADEKFPIGGSKVLRQSPDDKVTVVAAGITLFEALQAYEELKKDGITIRVIDLYSIKPIDVKTLEKAAKETQGIIVVEDHYPEGGIAEAVRSALGSTSAKIHSLAVRKMPRSGKPEELLKYEEISAEAIMGKIKKSLNPIK